MCTDFRVYENNNKHPLRGGGDSPPHAETQASRTPHTQKNNQRAAQGQQLHNTQTQGAKHTQKSKTAQTQYTDPSNTTHTED